MSSSLTHLSLSTPTSVSYTFKMVLESNHCSPPAPPHPTPAMMPFCPCCSISLRSGLLLGSLSSSSLFSIRSSIHLDGGYFHTGVRAHHSFQTLPRLPLSLQVKAKVIQWLQGCCSFALRIPQMWPLTCPSLLTLCQLLSPPHRSLSEQGYAPTTGALPLLCPLVEGSFPQMDTLFSQFFLNSVKPGLMTLLKFQLLLRSSPTSLYHFSSEHCLSPPSLG